jgi:hypothetical protein
MPPRASTSTGSRASSRSTPTSRSNRAINSRFTRPARAWRSVRLASP